MPQLLIAVVVVVGAIGLGLALRRRQRVDAPSQATHVVPIQLDRTDFADSATPWLVAVFSSASCSTCADVVRKAQVLRSKEVAVCDVEYTANRALHEKYSISAVPIVVIADAAGVVRAAFTGPVSATDLWAAVAEAREPGASPEPGLGGLG
jgi:hypothetical protein